MEFRGLEVLRVADECTKWRSVSFLHIPSGNGFQMIIEFRKNKKKYFMVRPERFAGQWIVNISGREYVLLFENPSTLERLKEVRMVTEKFLKDVG